MPSFIKSATCNQDWIKDQVSEICFVGRSNVGKSTLINVLANQAIAKTSKTPGRTQVVNFYDFGKYRLVDLPGYGFMIGSHKLKHQVSDIINEYLSSRANLYVVFQVCDANVITELDASMSLYIQKYFKNHYLILNKIDKKNISVYHNQKKRVVNYLHVPEDKIIFVSGKNKININKIKEIITKSIS